MNLITSESVTFRTRWNALVGFWVARANSEGITWCQRDSQHSAVRQSVLIGCTQSEPSFERAIMQMQGACFCIASCCCKWCKFLSLSEEIEFVAANARSPVKLPKLLICTYGVCSGEILQSRMNCVVHGYWKSVLVNLFPWVWWINLVCGNRRCDANWPKTIVLTLTYCVVGSGRIISMLNVPYFTRSNWVQVDCVAKLRHVDHTVQVSGPELANCIEY